MRKHLERARLHLLQLMEEHEPMAAAIQQHLQHFEDALQPPLRKQISFLHQSQRLIKLCISRAYRIPELLKKVLNAPDPLWSQMPELPVSKDLKQALAEQLFRSSQARTGEKIIIATTAEGRDVSEYLIQRCLQNGVDFDLGIKDPLRMTYLINELDEEGLNGLSQWNLKKYEGVHSEIILSSSTDPVIHAQLDQEKMKIYKQMNQDIHQRAMSGELHYTLTRIPNAHDAQMDDMEYEDYLRLFFELCDQPWKQIEVAQQHLIDRFDASKEVHITNADGTDIRLDVSGQTFANSVIAKNIPGSEIFSSPLREGVNGKIVAEGKFRYGSSALIENITLEFRAGRLESFSAEKGLKDLEELVTSDDGKGEGTRYLGELGIGTNPHLRRHVVNSLLVEKIGGSFHVALGSCYTYDEYLGTPVCLKNGNQSASGIHWDLTTLLRGKEGKMFIDGELIQDNGDWLGESYRVLNEGWGALKEDDQPDWWKERYSNGY